MTDEPAHPAREPAAFDLVDPVAACLGGRCPRCGEGRLFKGFVSLVPACSACGLSMTFADSADGPAVFIMLIAGFVVVGLALIVEIAYEPPYWLHLVLFLPLTVILCLGLMRPLKAVFIGLQYRNKAQEGQLADRAGR